MSDKHGVSKHGVSNIRAGEEWTVFVDNLNKRVSRGAFMEVFNHYGKVTSVFIWRYNKKPRYKNITYAFVCFATRGDMDIAINKMNNARIDGGNISVSIAKFPSRTPGQPKKKRSSEMANKPGSSK
ncbi:RNA-binding protein with serine-rich domain 1 homolog [Hibiscus syriacus]|nr:RNA-binding protein with serine-rich domain 1 homolog [Hibiscus syriacus]